MTFDYKTINFPYETVRPFQDALILNINSAIENNKCLIAHAPTGLGKTVASLAPAITHALKNGETVFYLTPRHSQHRMVIDTLKDISKNSGINIQATDLLGRQSMCPLEIAKELSNNDFMEYCKDLKQEGKCPYYKGMKGEEAKRVMNLLISKSPMHSEELTKSCTDNRLCPYETSLEIGKKSNVIICDYYYIFSDTIRTQLLTRLGKALEDSVLIIDEAHNLPDRIRDLMTHKLTTFMLKASMKELIQLGYHKEAENVGHVMTSMDDLTKNDKEGLIAHDEFIKKITSLTGMDYEELYQDLFSAGHNVRESNKKSFTLGVARFLEIWNASEQDRVRVFRHEVNHKGNNYTSITYHGINPAEYTESIFKQAKSSILMSGTLTPTKMYSEILGMPSANIIELKSPFPQENRLTLIIPETTTRYARRSDDEYGKIALKINTMLDNLSVNTAVFFPSYAIMNQVINRVKTDKKIIIEQPGLSKDERQVLINQFRLGKGNVLFAVASGSFGEGIDLPGTELECVIIVGVPLPVPDLYTKAVINYYELKYKKGWDYGYTMPALTKVIQNAGRCIRRESDRGLIVLLDERYAWDTYRKCIPPEWIVKTTKNPDIEIKNFFNKGIIKSSEPLIFKPEQSFEQSEEQTLASIDNENLNSLDRDN